MTANAVLLLMAASNFLLRNSSLEILLKWSVHAAWHGTLYYCNDQFEEAVDVALESFEIQKDYAAGYYVLENGKINSWIAHGLLSVNTTLDRKDKAFRWLAYEPHHAFTAWVAVLPEFEILRDDSRYEEFLERLNLPK